MKDDGRIMTEFIGLKSKMCTFKLFYSNAEIIEMISKFEKECNDNNIVVQNMPHLGAIKKAINSRTPDSQQF